MRWKRSCAHIRCPRAKELGRSSLRRLDFGTGALRPGNLPELLVTSAHRRSAHVRVVPGAERGELHGLAALAELADQVVVNSAAAPDATAALRTLGPFGPQITDFTWLRLLPWCELTAQFFDSESARKYLDQITMLQIEYSGSMAASVSMRVGSPIDWAGSRSVRIGRPSCVSLGLMTSPGSTR